MTVSRLLAVGATGLALALAGCAAPATEGDAVDLCEEQMAGDLETADNASATEWEGGRVEDRDRVFEYTAILTLGGVDIRVSCEVASTPDGFVLQDYDADADPSVVE